MILKIFTYLIAFYVLVLTTIPCADQLDAGVLHKTESSSGTTGEHQHECGQCSPFCTCNCCATPGIQQNNIIEFNSFTYTTAQVPVYEFTFESFGPASCWHPPKLS